MENMIIPGNFTDRSRMPHINFCKICLLVRSNLPVGEKRYFIIPRMVSLAKSLWAGIPNLYRVCSREKIFHHSPDGNAVDLPSEGSWLPWDLVPLRTQYWSLLLAVWAPTCGCSHFSLNEWKSLLPSLHLTSFFSRAHLARPGGKAMVAGERGCLTHHKADFLVPIW